MMVTFDFELSREIIGKIEGVREKEMFRFDRYSALYEYIMLAVHKRIRLEKKREREKLV